MYFRKMSNGMTGNSISVYRGGPLTVVATGDSGCSKTATITVPRHPSEYLWIFPTGCFEGCFDLPNAYFIGPSTSFANWSWNQSNNSVSSGTASDVDAMVFFVLKIYMIKCSICF